MIDEISTLAETYVTAGFKQDENIPVILTAYHPPGAAAVDRCAVYSGFTVGRKPDCGLAIADQRLSGNHFKFCTIGGRLGIADMALRNGTFLNGARVNGRTVLDENSVIRAGRSVFV